MVRHGRLTDQGYLRDEQYRDSVRLRDRMALHERFSQNRQGWQHWVFDRLALGPGTRALEVGCGPARLWLENAGRLPTGLRLTLSDYSPGMAREAWRAMHDLAADVRPVALAALAADAQALPFADAAFDVVIANHMLYHVPDRARAIAEFRRVLAPGGRLYAATNGPAHMRELDLLLGGARWGGELAFDLANGAAQLARDFARVELARYDDALVVTEAAPLLAYARSYAPPGLDLEQLAATVAARLAADGAIRIAKETGLFSAR